jgi:hypothetical protein
MSLSFPRPAQLFRAGLLFLAGLGGAGLGAAEPVRFSRDILPILSEHCFACHGPDAAHRKAGLRLDTQEGALAGGKDDGPALVPREPGRSSLIRRVESADPDLVMPPPAAKKPLRAEQQALLKRWVAEGGTWGRHWAFETPVRPALPIVKHPAAVRNPLDAFIVARLEAEGLQPSPAADRATWLRRVTLDLTGLPPEPADVAAFEQDGRPDAEERVVDRLLASPRYGERMAWEWLEAARYADSNGYQGDGERTMWPWRDWVVTALNGNLPFDRFSEWQLAGDRLPAATYEQRLATGFCRNHMINGEGGRIPEENRIDYLFDQAETTATVWLGATFNCTRCHDHKYDPFTQRDYFSLIAFFDRTVVDGSGGDPQSRPVLAAPSPAQGERLRALTDAVAAAVTVVETAEAGTFSPTQATPGVVRPKAPDFPEELRKLLEQSAAQRTPDALGKLAAHVQQAQPALAAAWSELKTRMEQRTSLERSFARVMVMEDVAKPRETRVLARGAYNQPGVAVTAAVPASLAAVVPPTRSGAAADRLDLARWLTDPAHPLTARVAVNRQWQLFFGTGLVKTAEDFGLQGERPSHPELLDWLAVDFVASGWDVKRLQRLIVTSATYRQSSRRTPELAERDPENRLLARGPRYRLPSWMIRDAALAAGGLLTDEIGGPPVKSYQPSGVWEEATFGGKRYVPDSGAALYRRSLYVFWRRIVGPTVFFDVANRQYCTVRTPRTDTPLQALLLLNDTTYVEAARGLAVRVLTAAADDGGRFDALYRRVLGRPPGAEERRILATGLERHRKRWAGDAEAARRWLTVGASPRDERWAPAELAAWTQLAATVLNLDEAISKE